MLCPSCSSDVSAGSAFCGACGSVVDETAARTQTSANTHSSVTSISDSVDDARFLPGTVIGDRYRVIGLLGRGGMGEVYRADDLKLGQPVALKFLSASVAEDQDRLNRLLHEVKIARQVSHPNVCRVYDVGETDGHHYLSMEYVDGENLATLLRRIGRLPGDKALEIARQLCAGLAAAHEQGILHRDLKPANVMLDGRGRAKLTDFGLAGLAVSIEGAEIRSGTPTYMAPEQLAGQEVTVRSDLYSLGLVLYELFTGRKAYEAATLEGLRRLQHESTPTSPASFMEGFDPAVERVLFLCLEKNPSSRPATALAVAAALPGGDPLAAALAAGETPSPEMVAAAGPEGALRPGIAIACLLAVVLGFPLTVFMGDRSSIYSKLPFVKSFAALQENASEIARRLGYEEPPADTSASYGFNFDEYFHQFSEGGAEGVSEALAQTGQYFVSFRYRQAPRPLLPQSLAGRVSAQDPSPGPGDLYLSLDLQGQLRFLRAQPPIVDDAESPEKEAAWGTLFEAAGLRIEEFEPVSPVVVPRTYVDERKAWSGVLPDHGDRPVRIEAATYRGKPVYFEKVISSDSYWSPEEESGVGGARAFLPALILIISLMVLIVAGGLFLTVRNLRLGRGDRRGASRLALVVFSLRMVDWILGADHAGHPALLVTLGIAVSGAVALAALAWIVYVAFEPYVRRLWPHAIVSWSRLVSGRFRDPLVGRDVLIGCGTAVASAFVMNGILWGVIALKWMAPIPDQNPLVAIRGGRFALSQLFSATLTNLAFALAFMMLFLLCRMILRKTWIAVAILCLLWGTQTGLQIAGFSESGGWIFGFVLGAAIFGFLCFVLVRFGLVSLVAFMTISGLMGIAPTTWIVSRPYFGTGLIFMMVIVALAVYAFNVALAGRSVMQDSLMDS